jgi:hypothetical protein
MKVLLLLTLLYCTASFGQNTFIVKAGTPINKALPPEELYQYADFRQGSIFYKDGRTASGKLNYHRLIDEMQFITLKGDTLAVDNEPTIRRIAIDKDTFYYAAGFVRVISATPAVMLAEKRWLKTIDKERYGGYGQTHTSSAITNIKLLDDGKMTHTLTVKENLVLAREVEYFFADRWDHFVKATKKNVLALFPRHEGAIRQYLKETKVDFENANDLQALAAFLARL